MKITDITTHHADAGWRDYHFVKISTDGNVTGWSEYDEGLGTVGVTTVINRLAKIAIGDSATAHERLFAKLKGASRQAFEGVVACGVGAIENALLDAKAKHLGVPCYELFGGKLRDTIRVYWSHCATWRIAHPELYPPAITDLDGVKALGAEAHERGFSALKTNIFTYDNGDARSWAPGFGWPFDPSRNVDKRVLGYLRAHLEALRDGAGPDMDILLDLNFNAATEGYLKIIRSLEDFDLFWVEIDTPNPETLAYIRSMSPHPISSCETLTSPAAFVPYFRTQAVDVAIIDAVWNGVWQSLKIAAQAEAHAVNVAPHNYYGHLATLMNAHMSVAIPNLRIMETDIDRLSWDDEIFTVAPEIINGELIISDTPGWGTEPDEAGLANHPSSRVR
ncbi:MAG: mandelate racemase/muconate lactonizing enzyme family protein [Gammaproteobacteria bacterium]|nr:mandelate racemase/muconate lactonizing enzyme family protein [Gammaproteobacteria bacterium]